MDVNKACMLASDCLTARYTKDGEEPTIRGHSMPTPVKALVWFWIIDETLVLTSLLSVCRLHEVGTCQVMEQVMIMVMTTR